MFDLVVILKLSQSYLFNIIFVWGISRNGQQVFESHSGYDYLCTFIYSVSFFSLLKYAVHMNDFELNSFGCLCLLQFSFIPFELRCSLEIQWRELSMNNVGLNIIQWLKSFL